MTESRYNVILQAALKGDPEIAGDMTEEERRSYESIKAEIDQNRADGKNFTYDIGYSYD